jgi:hypothetical protein
MDHSPERRWRAVAHQAMIATCSPSSADQSSRVLSGRSGVRVPRGVPSVGGSPPDRSGRRFDTGVEAWDRREPDCQHKARGARNATGLVLSPDRRSPSAAPGRRVACRGLVRAFRPRPCARAAGYSSTSRGSVAHAVPPHRGQNSKSGPGSQAGHCTARASSDRTRSAVPQSRHAMACSSIVILPSLPILGQSRSNLPARWPPLGVLRGLPEPRCPI